MVRFIICDDHKILRLGLKNFIEGMNSCTVIAEAANGEELLGLLNHGVIPDIVLLDINMPGEIDGYQVAKHIQKRYIDTRIICISLYSDVSVITTMLSVGVMGFVTKELVTEKLGTAIDEVMNDKRFVASPQLHFSGDVLPEFSNINLGLAMLTQREIELAIWMSTEKPYKEIASIMEISVNTLQNIRNRIFFKTGLRTRTEVAILMMRSGLLN